MTDSIGRIASTLAASNAFDAAVREFDLPALLERRRLALLSCQPLGSIRASRETHPNAYELRDQFPRVLGFTVEWEDT